MPLPHLMTGSLFIIYWFLAALGLPGCTRAFTSWGKGELLSFGEQGILIVMASLVVGHELWARGLSSCGPRAYSSASSWTNNWTHVPCTGRGILNHWTTREVHPYNFILSSTSLKEHFPTTQSKLTIMSPCSDSLQWTHHSWSITILSVSP